jgi:hypothetical protein
MSAYVDELRPSPRSAGWPYTQACHLYADTARELHELAGLIGLSRSWFHGRRDFPHYDLTAYKRGQAIARGAMTVDRRHAVEFVRRRRARREARKAPAKT